MMKMYSCYYILLINFVICFIQLSFAQNLFTFFDPNNPIVTTDYGPIRGSKYSPSQSLLANIRGGGGGGGNGYNGYGGINGQTQYVQFISVPYAAPPIGVNRFRPPHSLTEWTETLDCTGTNRIMCPQVYQRFKHNAANIRESEDCLYLNIYVPVDNRPITLPVLVYIHGGEFRFGGKDFYRPDFLLQAGGITSSNSHFIIVTLNYRLGVLGFLSTDDFNCPGNNGIRDQAWALQWIHRNIGKFGGNPQNITIMGHDAGGASVSFHLLNPEVNQYFTRAISISGTVFSPWAIQDNPLAMARDFAYRFSCGYRQDQIVECLRYQDLSQLMATSAERDWTQNRQPFWFRPVVDRNVSGSALLKDFPKNLYDIGQFNRKPYLVITTGSEGTLDFYQQVGHLPSTNDLERKISFLIRPYLKYYTNEQIMAAAFEYKYFNRTQRSLTIPFQNLIGPNSNLGQINSQYTLNNQINTNGYSPYKPGIGGSSSGSGTNIGYTDRELNELFSEMLGDFLYTGPIDMAARLHSAQVNTQLMVFNFVGQKSFGTIQLNQLQQPSVDTLGATHYNDLFYLLPNEYEPNALNGFEIAIARAYTRFIAEFVLFGFLPQSPYPLYQAAAPSYVYLNQQGNLIPVSTAQNQQNGYRISYLDYINNFLFKMQDLAVFFPPYFPQQEYKSYQQATWTLAGVLLFFILLALILIIVLIVQRKRKHNEEKREEENVSLRYRSDDGRH